MAHRVQQRPQRLSERGNGVHDSRRRIRINGTRNDTSALQFAELLGEGLLPESTQEHFFGVDGQKTHT